MDDIYNLPQEIEEGNIEYKRNILNLSLEKKVQSFCLKAIRKGWVGSAHDCSEGGLAVTLAECCISGPKLFGAGINVGARSPRPLEGREILFAETQSRIIVTLKEKDLQSFLKAAKLEQCPALMLGHVGGEELKIGELVDVPVGELATLWKEGFERKVFGG